MRLKLDENLGFSLPAHIAKDAMCAPTTTTKVEEFGSR